MKSLVTVLVFWLIANVAQGQELYVKAFGKPTDKAIIFLHGGPGYNAASFEVSTAQVLADNGFYVIVYDRRGEGRSEDKNAAFTYRESLDDINGIYKKYGLNKATLMGHSFGGVLAVLFAEQYPEKINSVILVSAPISIQQSLKSALNTVSNLYKQKHDTASLKYVSMIEKMDSTSLMYASYILMNAMRGGLYNTSNPTEEAKGIYSAIKADSTVKAAMSRASKAPQGFWKNEHYTTMDLTEHIKNALAKKVSIYALYGKEDGLYSQAQVAHAEQLLGANHVQYLENSSHNIFIDQRGKFIDAVKAWAR